MKIISFGNVRYKRIAHNWALYLHHHGIENYTIYSLDQDIHDYLTESGINTVLLKNNMFESEKFNWRERTKFIYNLLNKGEDILHSDLDAVWLRNPLHHLQGDHDIIASIGNHPRDICEKFGHTLCMGWIYYKSSDIVKKLFQNILKQDMMHDFDDQVEFNREIFKKCKYKKLKLKILNRSIVSRGNPHNKNTCVAHPASQKHIDREKFLKDKNLWILK